MRVILGESWSGNTLVYYPSRKDWGVRIDAKLEECTDKDIADANKAIEIRSYLIVNVVLEEIHDTLDP